MPSNKFDKNEYISAYSTTRVYVKLIENIGWLIVILGGIAILFNLANIILHRGTNWMQLASCIGVMTLGFISIITGQLTRAVVDNADNTGEIKLLLRKISSGNEPRS